MLSSIVPDTSNRIWRNLIKGQETINFEFLAANILIRNIQGLFASEPSEENLKMYTQQLRELFVRNSELPSVKKDIDKISNMVN